MNEKRIPIDDFQDFERCILKGTTFGIRWESAMEAFAETLKRRTAERRTIGVCMEDRSAA